jgi:hypothetical protein
MAYSNLQGAQDQIGAPKSYFRVSQPPTNFRTYVASMSSIIDSKPSNIKEANVKQMWQDAITEEYNSIMKNDVWEIIPNPMEKSVTDFRWLFKIKHAANGSIRNYKAKFVAKGFSLREGVDCENTFAPVPMYTSIQVIMSIALVFGWTLYQMDIKTAFSNVVIEEEIYINQCYKHNNQYNNNNNNSIIRLLKSQRTHNSSPRDQPIHISISSQGSL